MEPPAEEQPTPLWQVQEVPFYSAYRDILDTNAWPHSFHGNRI